MHIPLPIPYSGNPLNNFCIRPHPNIRENLRYNLPSSRLMLHVYKHSLDSSFTLPLHNPVLQCNKDAAVFLYHQYFAYNFTSFRSSLH